MLPKVDEQKPFEWKQGISSKDAPFNSNITYSPQYQKRAHAIKCFKCNERRHYHIEFPNKQIMLVRDHEDYTFDFDLEDLNVSTLVEDNEEEVLESLTDVKDILGTNFLVVQCTLNIDVRDDFHEQQTKSSTLSV